MILMAANPLLGPVGPEDLDFFGPWNGNERSKYPNTVSLDFQGPPLPVALQVYLPPSKSLRPVPYKQHAH